MSCVIRRAPSKLFRRILLTVHRINYNPVTRIAPRWRSRRPPETVVDGIDWHAESGARGLEDAIP